MSHLVARCELKYGSFIKVIGDRAMLRSVKRISCLSHIRKIKFGEKNKYQFKEYFDPAIEFAKQEKLKIKFS